MAYGAILGQQPPQQQLDAQDVNYNGTATGTNVKEALDSLKSVDDGLQETVDTLVTMVSGKAQIVTGNYVGTGTYGISNPNKLDFDRPPKIVFVSPGSNSSVFTGIFVSGVISVMLRSNVYVNVNWSENGLSWYTTQNTPVYQLNDSGKKYYYIAIL